MTGDPREGGVSAPEARERRRRGQPHAEAFAPVRD